MNNICKYYQKSTLSGWTTSEQTLEQQANLFFTDCSITGESIGFNCGSTSGLLIKKPGIYLLTIDADATMDDTAGDIKFQLTRNDVPITGAIATANSGQASQVQNLSITRVLTVKPSQCMPVYRIVNIGIKAKYLNMNVAIIKLA